MRDKWESKKVHPTFNNLLFFINFFRTLLKRRYEMVKYLLEHDADPNWIPPIETIVNNAVKVLNGERPFYQCEDPMLTTAILQCDFPLVKLLVQHGAKKEGFDVTNDELAKRVMPNNITDGSTPGVDDLVEYLEKASVYLPTKPLDAVHNIRFGYQPNLLYNKKIEDNIKEYIISLF